MEQITQTSTIIKTPATSLKRILLIICSVLYGFAILFSAFVTFNFEPEAPAGTIVDFSGLILLFPLAALGFTSLLLTLIVAISTSYKNLLLATICFLILNTLSLISIPALITDFDLYYIIVVPTIVVAVIAGIIKGIATLTKNKK